MKNIVNCLVAFALVGIGGLFCAVIINPFVPPLDNSLMSIDGAVFFCSLTILGLALCLLAVSFLFPRDGRSSGLPEKGNLNLILEEYNEDSLSEVLYLAVFLDYKWLQYELEAIVDKCIESGWIYNALEASEMANRELTQDELEVILGKCIEEDRTKAAQKTSDMLCFLTFKNC